MAQNRELEVEEHVAGALQHSLSVHVDKEQVIDPGLDFNEPEEQLWEVEEHVLAVLHMHLLEDEQETVVAAWL